MKHISCAIGWWLCYQCKLVTELLFDDDPHDQEFVVNCPECGQRSTFQERPADDQD